MMAKKPTVKKEPAPKKPSLDIKDEMYFADKKKYEWLSEQTPELAKSFSPLVAMKWLSVVDGPESGYYIQMTNDLINVGLWEMSKHPDLLWKLMCVVGTGRQQRHGWIKLASSRKSLNKLDQFFLSLHPHFNDDELALYRSKFTVDSLKQLLRDTAMSDADMKPLLDEFKKTND